MKDSLGRQQLELLGLSLFVGVVLVFFSYLIGELYAAKQVGLGVLLGQCSWFFNGLTTWLLFTKKHIAWIVMVNVIKYVILVVVMIAFIARLNAPLAGIGILLQITGTSLLWYMYKFGRTKLG